MVLDFYVRKNPKVLPGLWHWLERRTFCHQCSSESCLDPKALETDVQLWRQKQLSGGEEKGSKENAEASPGMLSSCTAHM